MRMLRKARMRRVAGSEGGQEISRIRCHLREDAPAVNGQHDDAKEARIGRRGFKPQGEPRHVVGGLRGDAQRDIGAVDYPIDAEVDALVSFRGDLP